MHIDDKLYLIEMCNTMCNWELFLGSLVLVIPVTLGENTKAKSMGKDL